MTTYEIVLLEVARRLIERMRNLGLKPDVDLISRCVAEGAFTGSADIRERIAEVREIVLAEIAVRDLIESATATG